MAAEILTPTCETTGLPLPILPSEPRIRGAFLFNRPNYHHPHHPDSDPVLADSRGRALRGSRMIKTPYANHLFYHQTFVGPELPETDEEVFKTLVLNVAGVIPKEGIDISAPHSWSQRPISEDEHSRFAQPGIIKVERAKNIARFISEYTLESRDDDLVSNRELEEFVDNNTSYERKREIASNFLGETLDDLLTELNPLHKKLKQEGLVVNKQSKTLRHVAKSLVRKHAFGYYTEHLFDKAAYG